MNVAVIIIVVVAVCCVLGGAKSKNVRKRKPKAATPRKLKATSSRKPSVEIESVRVEHEPSPAERAMMQREKELRKQATAYKRAKQYDKAVESLRAARKQQYASSNVYPIETLLRVPQYLILAGRYQEAVDEANDILRGKWEAAGTKAGGGQREARAFVAMAAHDVAAEAARKMGNAALAKEHEREARAAERSMPSMRIEDTIEDFKRRYKELGTDLGRISGDCGEAGAPCGKWHGRIISVLGRTAGWPTLADVDAEAVFGGELPHRIEYVDELLDADEIARQKARPSRRRT